MKPTSVTMTVEYPDGQMLTLSGDLLSLKSERREIEDEPEGDIRRFRVVGDPVVTLQFTQRLPVTP